MLSIQLWITFLLALWIYVLWSRRRIYQLMLKIPGSLGYPILGNLDKICGKIGVLKMFEIETRKWGSTWLCWFGPRPLLIVSDPQIAQDILSSPHTTNKARTGYNVIGQVIGNGVVLLQDPVWSTHRKALNPAFGHSVLLSFLPIFNNETKSLLLELDTLVGQGEKDIILLLKNASLRIATQTTMGTDVKREEFYQNNFIMNCYHSIFETGLKIFLSPWLNNKLMLYLTGLGQLLNTANSNIQNMIKKMIDNNFDTDTTSSSENIKYEYRNNMFIELAIKQFKNQVFNYQDIIDECHTIILAAFETSAITIAYTLIQLAMYPEYQERVFEEIKSLFPERGDFEVGYEDLQKLEYLEMVINETMRLMPAFPLIGRRTIQDVKLSNGVTLPKGVDIIINIYQTQRNKDVWGPEAEIFNPENCAPQNLQQKHPYAFMPFSKGKRKCLGWKYGMLSLKLALVKIIRNFKFSTSFRSEDLVLENNISLKFKDSACLALERRAS